MSGQEALERLENGETLSLPSSDLFGFLGWISQTQMKRCEWSISIENGVATISPAGKDSTD